MPLEQLTGQPLTLSVDVYAFGTLVWEVLEGREPLAALRAEGNVNGALVRAGLKLPPLTNHKNNSLDGPALSAFESLIRRATNNNAEKRPSMEDMEKMLKSILFTT